MKNKKNAIGAGELSKIKAINSENWKKISKEYIKWQKEVLHISSTTLYIILAIGLIAVIFLTGWIKWVIWFIVLRILYEISRREGHQQGYIDGYRDGHDAGINDYLGIDDEQQEFINEMEIDQEMNNYKN